MDVRQDTAGGNGDATEQLVQLLIVADGKLDVAGGDALLVVVAGGVASGLEDLSRGALKGGSEVRRGTSSDAGGAAANAEVAAGGRGPLGTGVRPLPSGR